MKFYVAKSKEAYERIVTTNNLMPGDRILIDVPGRGMYTEIARVNNDGSTRQQRRALKRENLELAMAVEGVNRKKRRAIAKRGAHGVK